VVNDDGTGAHTAVECLYTNDADRTVFHCDTPG
jgi:hypothetical protein